MSEQVIVEDDVITVVSVGEQGPPGPGPGPASTDQLPEGQNNKYFTPARAKAAAVADTIAAGVADVAPSQNATYDALATKQPLDADLTAIAALSPTANDLLQYKAGAWTNRSPSQFETDLALIKADVGLGSVDNTSDVNKPESTAQAAADSAVATTAQTNLTAHTSRVDNPHSVTKAQVGLGNVDNTSDAAKPVSVAAQTALDLKAPLGSPAFTGSPTGPTAAMGTNTLQLATTAFVQTTVGNLINAAPTALDTLNELAAALGNDPNFATTVTNNLAGKVSKAGDRMTGQLVLPTNGVLVGSNQLAITNNGIGIGRTSGGYSLDIQSSNFNGIRITASDNAGIYLAGSSYTSNITGGDAGATVYIRPGGWNLQWCFSLWRLGLPIVWHGGEGSGSPI